MNSMNKGRTVEITSLRDLEKEFANISKLFTGKETEHNWEARDASVKRMRQFLKSGLAEQYKDETLKGLHDHMSSIIKGIHSLRTSVAIEALSFIEDTSCSLGDRIDIYTLETILSNLLKCSSNTKKIIATKTEQVTITFLTNTSFHSKLMIMLCKTVNEKNTQLRQFATNYIRSLLSAHGSKESVRSAVQKTELSYYIEQFLKKGLVDASPAIREACRSMYGMYHLYWPDQAGRLNASLETTVQRQLERSTSKATPGLISSNNKSFKRTLVKRSNSASSISSSNTTAAASLSSTAFKPPTLKKSSSFKTCRPTIPATSAEIKRTLTAQRLSRLSHISNASAPPTEISHKISHAAMGVTLQQRRAQSEFHMQSAQASNALLSMLKSNDTHMKCKGIRQLAQKLQNVTYDPSLVTTISLPPGVPSRIDLLNVFTSMLSRNDFDLELYHILMSWESLAGIFVYIMSLNYYGPTLIVANEEECIQHNQTQKLQDIKALYTKGLKRIKMFLKRHDPYLPKQLLDMLQSLQAGNMHLFDALKRDLMAYPSYMMSLQCGLLNWLDEILCDYVGLPEDDDAEMLMEGSKWLHMATQQHMASQWFDDNFNVRSLIRFVLHRLALQEENETYSILCRMGAHLKMANERVFEQEMDELDKTATVYVKKTLCAQTHEVKENLDGLLSIFNETPEYDNGDNIKLNEFNVDSITLEDLYEEVVKEEVGKWNEMLSDNHQEEDQSTGMTQEISNINLQTDAELLEEESLVESPKEDKPDLENRPIEVDRNRANDPQLDNKEKQASSTSEPIDWTTKDERNVEDRRTVKESAHDCYFSNKKKLARRAPEPTPSSSSSSISGEEESKSDLEPNKKRRQNKDTLPDMTLGLSQCLTEISQCTATKATFKKIQKLIIASSVTQDENNKTYWDQRCHPNDPLFITLLETLLNYISNLKNHSGQLYVLDTLIKMFVDLRTLFKQLEENGRNATMYRLLKTLIDNHCDNQSEVDIKSEKAINMLLSIHSPEFALQMLWQLSGNYLKKENRIGNLLILISELAPKASPTALEKSLQSGAADILIWGYGHTNASIRKSSFLASAGIYQVLGDSYIGTYLPSLRPEQKTILMHYIETTIKR